jgi:hypothetical protein
MQFHAIPCGVGLPVDGNADMKAAEALDANVAADFARHGVQ